MPRRRGFTLVEIMIVVLIIGVLAAIGIASVSNARDRSRSATCIATLRQLDSAKEQFAMMNKLDNGAAVLDTDVYPLLLKGTPKGCPAGGTYNIQPVGTYPTCTVVGTYPHVLN